jgi:hypothetical protein
MSEAPRGPRSNEADRGLQGYNIERWDVLRNESMSFEEKRDALIISLQKDIDALEERQNSEEAGLDAELDNLYFDLDDVQGMHASDLSMQKLYQNKVEFYTKGSGTM